MHYLHLHKVNGAWRLMSSLSQDSEYDLGIMDTYTFPTKRQAKRKARALMREGEYEPFNFILWRWPSIWPAKSHVAR